MSNFSGAEYEAYKAELEALNEMHATNLRQAKTAYECDVADINTMVDRTKKALFDKYMS